MKHTTKYTLLYYFKTQWTWRGPQSNDHSGSRFLTAALRVLELVYQKQ